MPSKLNGLNMTGSIKDENKRNKEKRYLLILPCSKKKREVAAARAIDLYNGPFYQILRKHGTPNLDVLILSAKHGLIEADEIIYLYDQKMTKERAQELSESVRKKLEMVITTNHYEEILVNLGTIYMAALNRSKNTLGRYNVSYASGRIGERIKQLKEWLSNVYQDRC